VDLAIFWNLSYNGIREQTCLINIIGTRQPSRPSHPISSAFTLESTLTPLKSFRYAVPTPQSHSCDKHRSTTSTLSLRLSFHLQMPSDTPPPAILLCIYLRHRSWGGLLRARRTMRMCIIAQRCKEELWSIRQILRSSDQLRICSTTQFKEQWGPWSQRTSLEESGVGGRLGARRICFDLCGHSLVEAAERFFALIVL
jgi:hypothetical protein